MTDFSGPEEILSILKEATELNRDDSLRQGHLLTFPDYGQVIMTGDFHGCLDNFRKLHWLADLKKNFARHVLVHELIHSNSHVLQNYDTLNGRSVSGDESCLLLFQAAKWKTEFPDQVHFLMGNHDLAQITSREITKGGSASIANFNKYILDCFGETTGTKIIEQIHEFLLSLPLAARTANRIWLAHSLPNVQTMDIFDFSIFDRPWTESDLLPRGSVYEAVWGRNHPLDYLDELGRVLGVDIFVVGHQWQEQGFLAVPNRLIILASDHSQGCYLPIDLSKKYTFNELSERIKFFYDIPELS